MATSNTTKLGIAIPVPGSGEPFRVAAYNSAISSLDAAAGATVVASEAARPAAPFEGQLIFQQDTLETFLWDGDANVWQPAGGGGGASVTVSDTAPADDPESGDLWWDSTDGSMYVHYVDDNGTAAWVGVIPGGMTNTDGNPGSRFYVGNVDPTTDYAAQLAVGDVWIQVP